MIRRRFFPPDLSARRRSDELIEYTIQTRTGGSETRTRRRGIDRDASKDLAEIIDKICEVVRERFKILGMVQALTGEGRLSGAVLMALPIGLFIAVYFINREYVMLLFQSSFGKQMIGFAIVMQIFGAFVIKKIIDIKV